MAFSRWGAPCRSGRGVWHTPLPIATAVGILVADVWEQVATGMAWQQIVADWRGAVGNEAITEAMRLAREALERERIRCSQPMPAAVTPWCG